MDAWTAFCLAPTVFHFIAPDKKKPASAEFLPIFRRNVAAPTAKQCVCRAPLASLHRIMLGCFEFLAIETHSL